MNRSRSSQRHSLLISWTGSEWASRVGWSYSVHDPTATSQLVKWCTRWLRLQWLTPGPRSRNSIGPEICQKSNTPPVLPPSHRNPMKSTWPNNITIKCDAHERAPPHTDDGPSQGEGEEEESQSQITKTSHESERDLLLRETPPRVHHGDAHLRLYRIHHRSTQPLKTIWSSAASAPTPELSLDNVTASRRLTHHPECLFLITLSVYTGTPPSTSRQQSMTITITIVPKPRHQRLKWQHFHFICTLLYP